ncbi:FG-GAP repeat domain-containing protein [Streptomyces sp. e14]|nr:FG-GAP repeat domain-containing protein [Streptomyces sp. e14]
MWTKAPSLPSAGAFVVRAALSCVRPVCLMRRHWGHRKGCTPPCCTSVALPSRSRPASVQGAEIRLACKRHLRGSGCICGSCRPHPAARPLLMTQWRTLVVKSSGLKARRAVARGTVAVLAAALVATGTSAASAADAPSRTAAQATTHAQPSGVSKFGVTGLKVAQVNALYGVDGNGELWGYPPNGKGGLSSRMDSGSGWKASRFITQADQDADGSADGLWDVTDGQLYWTAWDGTPALIGNGWNIYNRLLSAGNLGGAAADDLLARDSSGTLYLYLGYGTGKLASRYKVGGGWNIYTDITGKGDLTGDGKDDIVAKDSSGVLWLYKGTGNYKAPFAPRTKIGGGWNTYNSIVSVGDINRDGITDLVARDKTGALYLYKGTGNASAPYASRVKIGTSGWNTYRLLF